MSEQNNIELPSLLSFERKLEPSDALMFSGNWEDIGKNNEAIEKKDEKVEKKVYWSPVKITKRQNRSTQSSHNTNPNDMAKSNPVEGDDANLSHDKDTLKVSFSLRVIGNIGKPFACNMPVFENAIIAKTAAFKENQGFKALAFRYAYNIANGRFLWRNRVCAEEIKIFVTADGFDEPLIFDAYHYALNDFSKAADCQLVNTLAQKIQAGLEGDNQSFVLLEINAYVKLGKGQHVFPSQEMNMGEKKKVLFKLDDIAAIHSVKIGNAIRTIDDWYQQYQQVQYPIAAEPFGAVTQRGAAYRQNAAEGDLYSSMLAWVNNPQIDNNLQSYIVANLIRGGVFSKGSTKGEQGES